MAARQTRPLSASDSEACSTTGAGWLAAVAPAASVAGAFPASSAVMADEVSVGFPQAVKVASTARAMIRFMVSPYEFG
jgi:hypothetical protein